MLMVCAKGIPHSFLLLEVYNLRLHPCKDLPGKLTNPSSLCTHNKCAEFLQWGAGTLHQSKWHVPPNPSFSVCVSAISSVSVVPSFPHHSVRFPGPKHAGCSTPSLSLLPHVFSLPPLISIVLCFLYLRFHLCLCISFFSLSPSVSPSVSLSLPPYPNSYITAFGVHIQVFFLPSSRLTWLLPLNNRALVSHTKLNATFFMPLWAPLHSCTVIISFWGLTEDKTIYSYLPSLCL